MALLVILGCVAVGFFLIALVTNRYEGEVRAGSCFWHDWQEVEDTGIHRYEMCATCQGRRVVQVATGGTQPIDRAWLETGRWMEWTTPPKSKG